MTINAFACALDVLEATPTGVRALVAALPPALLDAQPIAEQWSVRDVLAHLLHVETVVIRPRIERMLAEDDPLLTAAPPPAPMRDVNETLAAWADARAANLPFLRALTPAQLARTARHPRYGTISVRDHVVEWAYHDQDHLRQIAAIIQAALYPEMGVFQTLYPRPG